MTAKSSHFKSVPIEYEHCPIIGYSDRPDPSHPTPIYGPKETRTRWTQEQYFPAQYATVEECRACSNCGDTDKWCSGVWGLGAAPAVTKGNTRTPQYPWIGRPCRYWQTPRANLDAWSDLAIVKECTRLSEHTRLPYRPSWKYLWGYLLDVAEELDLMEAVEGRPLKASDWNPPIGPERDTVLQRFAPKSIPEKSCWWFLE